MDAIELNNLYESYLEVYMDEATKGEKHLNLSDDEKNLRRNIQYRSNPRLRNRDPIGYVPDYSSDEITRQRKRVHTANRGVSPKRRNAEIRRQHVYSKQNSTPVDDTPRMPPPQTGRKKSVGSSSIVPGMRNKTTKLKTKISGSNNIRSFTREDYEYIAFYLLNGGYAETPEAAEAMMVNMSEEWRESIINY